MLSIEKNNLSKEWETVHHIGKLTLLGADIHDLFDSPFFKDHDFVVLRNKTSNKVIAVDPSVYDYLWIEEVSFEKN